MLSELIFEELFVDCVPSDYKLRYDLDSPKSEFSLATALLTCCCYLRVVERAAPTLFMVRTNFWLLLRIWLIERMRNPVEAVFSIERFSWAMGRASVLLIVL